MSMIARFRRWFEHEQDAHGKVVAYLGTVPQSQRSSAEYQRALSTLAHITSARAMWLHRLGFGERPLSLFPKATDVAKVTTDLRAVEQRWSERLAQMTDADLAQTFEYKSTEGKAYRNTVEEVLTQLFGHAWYHRGQIALLVRKIGGEPVDTDFILWCRKSL